MPDLKGKGLGRFGGNPLEPKAGERYVVTDGRYVRKRTLTDVQVATLRENGVTVTPRVEYDKAQQRGTLVSDYKERLQKGDKTQNRARSAGKVADILLRGSSVNAPTKTGQSEHFRRWMADRELRTILKDEV